MGGIFSTIGGLEDAIAELFVPKLAVDDFPKHLWQGIIPVSVFQLLLGSKTPDSIRIIEDNLLFSSGILLTSYIITRNKQVDEFAKDILFFIPGEGWEKIYITTQIMFLATILLDILDGSKTMSPEESEYQLLFDPRAMPKICRHFGILSYINPFKDIDWGMCRVKYIKIKHKINTGEKLSSKDQAWWDELQKELSDKQNKKKFKYHPLKWHKAVTPPPDPHTTIPPPSKKTSSVLFAGGSLKTNEYLQSPDGKYRLYQWGDGNLGIMDMTNKQIGWETRKHFKHGTKYVTILKNNCDLITYDLNTISAPVNQVWRSQSNAGLGSKCTLVMDNDARIRIYTDLLQWWVSDPPIWQF
jgi:hypothetical protein